MGKNSILIVDDDLILLKTAEEILSSIYTVSVAKSGKQAITLLKKGARFDIVRYRYAGNGWIYDSGKNEIYSELSGYSCNISHWICGVRL